MTLTARFHESIHEFDAQSWSGLWASDNPFIRFEFLAALEDSGCVSEHTGWKPFHLALYRGSTLVAALPLYLKQHSHGEFVFDWSWADAYQQHGLSYYPKLLTAVPFTPSAGPRVAISREINHDDAWRQILDAIREQCRANGISGWHLLFPHEAPVVGNEYPLLERNDVQFHWHNRDYASFEDFLASLRSGRRKNLRRERNSLAGLACVTERKTGAQITAADWEHFYQCYCHTYRKRSGHSGYLNREFFDALLRRMPEQLMLVVARRESVAVASALFLFDKECLYGRYWGALESLRNLHFECCFYQGMDFCIEQGIARFDPGTQGEHKLLRGFEPVTTRSWHWLADARFREAVGQFLAREKMSVDAYTREVSEYLPFRRHDDG
ncbi:MAG: N-acetyltransferase [Xanthomonadales bacterium]|nr:GNAT family N-acetyltransferase [Gammaproteobacteria bacterium]NNE04718.1 N-acetyltransferase [Xanthomonadales bacterium]NNL94025.1 N-acetyltransferase [Xanthomonadales bacterium]